MQVAVWDTYVTKKDGKLMHFDILVPESEKEEANILCFGLEYLKSKKQEGQPLTSKECTFCHIEKASEEISSSILEKGYYIVEMQGCS
jgi:hypothetical protein